MDNETHRLTLDERARAELADARDRLDAAGQTIATLRADAQELARQLATTRQSLEASHAAREADREQAASQVAELTAQRDAAVAQRDAAATQRDVMLEQVAKLKENHRRALSRPARLVVKKALGKGQYRKP